MIDHIYSVDLKKAHRLVNHGPTVLVSARYDGIDDVMAVAWCCGLDFAPPKLTVVIDKTSRTRSLIEASGRFAVQVPVAAQVEMTRAVGTRSLHDEPDKLAISGISLVKLGELDLPFVRGCAAWLSCRLVTESHNQDAYDLFIGEVEAAWADDRVFQNGHWQFETAAPELRSIHHVAGGHFYAIGDPLSVPGSLG